MDDTGYVYVLLFLILGIYILSVIIKMLTSYFRERRYIKMEIERTTGEENYYWRMEFKALNCLLIPFIGPVIAKKLRR